MVARAVPIDYACVSHATDASKPAQQIPAVDDRLSQRTRPRRKKRVQCMLQAVQLIFPLIIASTVCKPPQQFQKPVYGRGY